ncbi:hypothetical protein MKZ87_21670 [Pseudomonas sp. MCal1]|uniref:hypothetical protein n=1 Tax=Pseudomonas sp. MCal1 TaxID=2919887 RepID=UPI00225AA00B|nr:hypothetical protein [Pseudomonas sp. MCal1]MCX4220257.1 hypothetical protein [Pseudomonas sp. MCal1]
MKRFLKSKKGLIFLVTAFYCGFGYAYEFPRYDISEGYSSCSYVNNGDGTSTISLDIKFKKTPQYISGAYFISRAVMLFLYNKEGRLTPSSSAAKTVSINGSNGYAYIGTYYNLYRGSGGDWSRKDPFVATVKMVIANDVVKDWPAVGMAAGAFTSAADYIDGKGLAYISPGNKSCIVLLNPEFPPPPVDTLISMKAPDWDLGELNLGKETSKFFSQPSEQLCFTYEGSNYIIYQKFLIDASSSNGVTAEGNYLLRNEELSTSTVPYRLTLDELGQKIVLPNTSKKKFNLNKSGKTCFAPTFSAWADRKAKSGNYSDILTFTIVAQP